MHSQDQKKRAFATACMNLGHSSDKRMWYDDIYYWQVPEQPEVDSGESDFEASASDQEDHFDNIDDIPDPPDAYDISKIHNVIAAEEKVMVEN